MKRGFVSFLIGLGLSAAQAQTAYRWVDEQGRVHYGDRPPPAVAGKAQALKPGVTAAEASLPAATRQAMANFPVTLYVSADCGSGCEEARQYLKRRAIPFTEKSIASAEDVEALKKLAGDAFVPVMTLGARVVKGWQRDEWQRMLDAAGYPAEKAGAR